MTSPEDILVPGNERKLETTGFIVRSRSIVVLVNKFALVLEEKDQNYKLETLFLICPVRDNILVEN